MVRHINLRLVALVVAAVVALSAMLPVDSPPRMIVGSAFGAIDNLISPRIVLGDWQVRLPTGASAENLSLDSAVALISEKALGAPAITALVPEPLSACAQLRITQSSAATVLLCRASGGVEAASKGIESAQLALIARAEEVQRSIVARTRLDPFWLGGSGVNESMITDVAAPGRIVGESVRPFELGTLTAFGFCFETGGKAEWYSFGNADKDLLFLWGAGTTCEELWPAVMAYGASD